MIACLNSIKHFAFQLQTDSQHLMKVYILTFSRRCIHLPISGRNVCPSENICYYDNTKMSQQYQLLAG